MWILRAKQDTVLSSRSYNAREPVVLWQGSRLGLT